MKVEILAVLFTSVSPSVQNTNKMQSVNIFNERTIVAVAIIYPTLSMS